MSGLSAPTPWQNRFIPPPVPVDSISGDLNSGLLLANLSETALAKGKTVDEPTARIESRAPEVPLWPQAARARVESARRRSEEHTSELQSLMRISYAVLCLKKKKTIITTISQLT